jgi:AbrB family looped-hinge helix DNA binding protein
MYKTKMTSKGQLTLPKKLRDKIGLEPGDYLEVHETPGGYLLRKQVSEDRFKKYVGVLKRAADSDQVIKELRE